MTWNRTRCESCKGNGVRLRSGYTYDTKQRVAEGWWGVEVWTEPVRVPCVVVSTCHTCKGKGYVDED